MLKQLIMLVILFVMANSAPTDDKLDIDAVTARSELAQKRLKQATDDYINRVICIKDNQDIEEDLKNRLKACKTEGSDMVVIELN